ncbi:transcription termination factor MTEF18, mitochondrial [Salvia miltiorrhiza]|uniref:transcription termination factor MTEF18, mitochondrial n=1 Tax=Salvia miltiorrhiza TaxID=226208 RepID=UPI0025AC654C|nr:transcription termination factor MTEF18, mitochondrial [Salvia miltiorrhiza]
MLLHRTTAAAAVVFHRTTTKISLLLFSTSTAPKPFAKIPWKYRSKAIQESQAALLDYLHTTRALPFLYADHISRNSPQCLSKVVSKVPFSPSNFLCSFQRFLRYHPINELEFLLESIGLNCDENETARDILPKNTFFISDWKRFDVVCALGGMGFPWRKLGLLCRDDCSIFGVDPSHLERRIGEIKGIGFNGVSVISIALAFPQVLYSNADGLLGDLKLLMLDYDLLSAVDGNVDTVLEVCEKIKLFYDLGCEMGKVGELMGRSKCIFVEYSKEHLIGKIEYFCRLNVRRDQVGLLLLSRPEIFGFGLEGRVISVSGFLAHFGMEEEALKSLEQKYPHVFGRNRLENVPCVMRAMDIGEWFFERLQNGDPALLTAYTMPCSEDLDKHYEEGLRKLQDKRTRAYMKTKLDFIHSLGFGENKFAVKALSQMHSSSSELQQRFDLLLSCGIEYSKLCALLKYAPRILNQKPGQLEKKIEYFCTEMGASLQYLDVFPGYLCHDLEKRIKPRYRFHKWLKEQGYSKKNYSMATIIASSEKTFIARISRMDHAAAKMWENLQK